jgi:hypothetical protein
MTVTYSESPNKLISAANGIDYAYRETGDGPVPLVLLQHFHGNLDNWDPALIDALASARRVRARPGCTAGHPTSSARSAHPKPTPADTSACFHPVAYDSVASEIAPYHDPAASEVAERLDTEVLGLLRQVTGVPASATA